MSFFLKKQKTNVLSHAMLPSEGSRMDDPNQNTHPRMSVHHEDPSKTANWSWKELKGKCLRQFLKRKMRLGKTLFLPSDFKTKSFEIHIMGDSCEKASEQQRQ